MTYFAWLWLQLICIVVRSFDVMKPEFLEVLTQMHILWSLKFSYYSLICFEVSYGEFHPVMFAYDKAFLVCCDSDDPVFKPNENQINVFFFYEKWWNTFVLVQF